MLTGVIQSVLSTQEASQFSHYRSIEANGSLQMSVHAGNLVESSIKITASLNLTPFALPA